MKLMNTLNGRNFENEIVYNATRSSGPGGQNVNKVNTRIELRFDINASQLLTVEEKETLVSKLRNRISKEGILILVSQSERSQIDNKTKVTERFYSLMAKALAPVKKRSATRPTFASRLKRLESKKIRAQKKVLRKTTLED